MERLHHARRTAPRAALARDAGTILACGILAILASQALGGAAPAPASPTDQPDQTGVAVASVGGPPPTMLGLMTLGPIVDSSLGIDATPTPVPFATLGPSTLKVILAVTNDNGGNDVASDWTITVTGSPAPVTFAGSASGTNVPIDPDTTFTITTKPKTAGGYVETRSGNCTGPIARAGTATCTITENDKPVAMTVKVVIKGGTATPGQVSVTVAGTGVDKPKFAGSATGTLVHFNANAKWTITTSALASYARSGTSGCASAAGAAEGAAVSCTFTFTFGATPPPPTPAPPPPSVSVACDVPVGLQVTCSATVSSIQAGSEVWSMGGTGTVNAGGAGTTSITFTYDLSGTYSVTLTVTGLNGSTVTSTPQSVTV